MRHDPGYSEPLTQERRTLLLRLLLPPALFLCALGVRYALVVAACIATGPRIAMEAMAAVTLAAMVLVTLSSLRAWRREGMDGATEAPGTEPFLAALSALGGLLFIAATLALWLPSLFLDPCSAAGTRP